MDKLQLSHRSQVAAFFVQHFREQVHSALVARAIILSAQLLIPLFWLNALVMNIVCGIQSGRGAFSQIELGKSIAIHLG
ncbi:MAG: hypothetical protein DME22_01730 [Verrucomicrobia bacterium]|nr:MAG: hypothetical protein DME22_01730 [Verrucomicrobiota bacterium]PYJ98793.1 MAG: hypothetical protein DME23_11110 [Verrucomicrobiota bacterium]